MAAAAAVHQGPRGWAPSHSAAAALAHSLPSVPCPKGMCGRAGGGEATGSGRQATAAQPGGGGRPSGRRHAPTHAPTHGQWHGRGRDRDRASKVKSRTDRPGGAKPDSSSRRSGAAGSRRGRREANRLPACLPAFAAEGGRCFCPAGPSGLAWTQTPPAPPPRAGGWTPARSRSLPSPPRTGRRKSCRTRGGKRRRGEARPARREEEPLASPAPAPPPCA